MANATMTEKMAWTEVVALATANGNTELATYAEGKLAKLAEKAANRKPTKTQLENVELKAKLFAAMETGRTYTAAELGALVGVTAQKATALVKMLVEAGVVTVTENYKPEGKGRGVKGYTAEAAEYEGEVED